MAIPEHVPLKWAVGVALTIATSAFGAGVAYVTAVNSARAEVAGMVALAKLQADAARAEGLTLQQDLRALRKDLSLGFGRCLIPPVKEAKARWYARDDAGKRAQRLYVLELGQGVPGDEAMRHVLESDF